MRLEFLACPSPGCAGQVSLTEQTVENLEALQCSACGSLYPIADGIPLLYHPPAEYVHRAFQTNSATADYLRNFRSGVGEADPYYRFAGIWLARVNACIGEMGAIQRIFKELGAQQAVFPPDEFKAEYSKLEVIEEYLKSAYGIYLPPPAGNREGFYATVLSAGKTLPKDAHVLDIGCGVGRTVLDYSLLCPEGQVIGFDYTYGTLRLAKQVVTTATATSVLAKVDFARHDIQEIQGFHRRNVAFVAGTAEILPFREGVFDCVLGNYIFSIVGDYRAALRKAARLVKPGGMLITTNGFSWEDLREAERRHTPDAMKEVLESEGFHVELDFDFANLNTGNQRHFHLRNTRLILGKNRN